MRQVPIMLAITALAACAAPTSRETGGSAAENTGTTAQAIINGDVVAPENIEGLGFVKFWKPYSSSNGGTEYTLRSGTLITNEWMLTSNEAGDVQPYGVPITVSLGDAQSRLTDGQFNFPWGYVTMFHLSAPFVINGSTTSFQRHLNWTADPDGLIAAQTPIVCYGYGVNDYPSVNTGTGNGRGTLRSALMQPYRARPSVVQTAPNAWGQTPSIDDFGGGCTTTDGLLTAVTAQCTSDGFCDHVVSSEWRDWVDLMVNPFAVGGTGGGDPKTGYDNCAGAAIMCSVQRKAEYDTLGKLCAMNRGKVPPCAWPTAASVCAQTKDACVAGDAETYFSLSDECTALGGKPAPCPGLIKHIRFPRQ